SRSAAVVRRHARAVVLALERHATIARAVGVGVTDRVANEVVAQARRAVRSDTVSGHAAVADLRAGRAWRRAALAEHRVRADAEVLPLARRAAAAVALVVVRAVRVALVVVRNARRSLRADSLPRHAARLRAAIAARRSTTPPRSGRSHAAVRARDARRRTRAG